MRVLLERGADVNARADNGATPLHWYASSKGPRCLISSLILSSSFVRLYRCKHGYSLTPFRDLSDAFRAAGNGCVGALRVLLEGGADPHLSTYTWATQVVGKGSGQVTRH